MQATRRAALIAAWALAAVGCSDDTREPPAPSAGPDAGPQGFLQPELDAIQCQSTLASLREDVFAVGCSFEHCHANAPAFGLRLDSSDLAALEARLVNVEAVGCRGEQLVVPGVPQSSYLYRKLADEDPPCAGDRMPHGALGVLPAHVLACVAGWIRTLPRERNHDTGSDQ